MTSDQQSHFECSIADCTNVEKAFDNIIAANNIGLENETVTNSGSKTSQYEENGQSEYEKVSAIEENVNIGQGEQMIPCGADDENNFEGTASSDEKLQFEVNGDAESCHSNGGQKGVSGCFNSRNESSSPTINNEAMTLSVSGEQPIIDSQSPHETFPALNLDQQGTSNEKQPQSSLSDAEIKYIHPAIQEEETSLIEKKDLPNLPPETTNQIAESVVVNASAIADDEIENSAEASNDENETSSNEHDSNEDSSEFPDIVDFDATNEAENDEYILDTVVRKRRKARRRIVSVNDDDSDAEMEIERKRLLQSPTIEENELTDIDGAEEDIELLIQNEKPGPKSKKMSTQKLKELQTRELLRNAVVIPSGKKRKSRIVDSDDEEDALLPYCVNVDDIGVPDVTDDNDNETDVLVGNSILLNDIDKAESSSVDNLNQTRDASSIEIETLPDVNYSDGITLKVEPEHDDLQENIKSTSHQDLHNQPSEVVPVLVKQEPVKSETTFLCDSGNSTDSTNQQCKKGNEIDTVAKEFRSFSASSSSDGENEFIPNDVYFGTPDNNKRRYVST